MNLSLKSEAISPPKIPYNLEDAFLPLRKRADGKILPSFQFKECTKRIIICVKWEKKTIYFEDLEHFYNLGFGLYKMRAP